MGSHGNTLVTFSDTFNELANKIVYEADTVTVTGSNDDATFYNHVDDKFYSTLTVSPDPSKVLTFPFTINLSMMKQKYGDHIIGREINGTGTEFTLQFRARIRFWGDTLKENWWGWSGTKGKEEIHPHPGTYTCSQSGLRIWYDPAPGSPKTCTLVVPRNVFKVLDPPANCLLTYTGEMRIY